MKRLAHRFLTSAPVACASLAVLVCLLAAMLPKPPKTPKFPKGMVQRIPGWSTGFEPDQGVGRVDLSANGRWAAIESNSTNLLLGPAVQHDIYLYDSRKDVTIPVALTVDGGAPALGARRPAISSSGKHVVYDSADSEIVEPDPGFSSEVFLFDVKKGSTERISVDSNGDAVSGHSTKADVNKNGKLVVFQSTSSKLVPGDTNNKFDIFLRNRKKGLTTRLSLASDGSQADEDCKDPSISANGRIVAFTTKAALVPEDTNGFEDVYAVDLKKGTIVRASVATDGTQGMPVMGSVLPPRSGPDISISANGRFLAFRTDAHNLESESNYTGADVLLRDLKKKTTVLVSIGPENEPIIFGGLLPAISPEGRFVAFRSQYNDPITQIFLRDMKKGTSVRMTLGPNGIDSDGSSSWPCLSGRAKYVAFPSEAKNLTVAVDTNNFTDCFLLRR